MYSFILAVRLQARIPALLVLPYGPVFPAEARQAVIAYPRDGGCLLSVGGYAFERLVRRTQDRWVDEKDRLDALRREALRPERSLLSDGGFEKPEAEIPIGGFSNDGPWRRAGGGCHIVGRTSITGFARGSDQAIGDLSQKAAGSC